MAKMRQMIVFRSAPMPHVDRSRLMMFMTVAALTLCGGRAYTQDEDQPTNDLPNPYQTTAPWGKLPRRKDVGSTERRRDR